MEELRTNVPRYKTQDTPSQCSKLFPNKFETREKKDQYHFQGH